jgi:hypothetical protein
MSSFQSFLINKLGARIRQLRLKENKKSGRDGRQDEVASPKRFKLARLVTTN